VTGVPVRGKKVSHLRVDIRQADINGSAWPSLLYSKTTSGARVTGSAPLKVGSRLKMPGALPPIDPAGEEVTTMDLASGIGTA